MVDISMQCNIILVSNILIVRMREELMRSNGEDKECNI